VRSFGAAVPGAPLFVYEWGEESDPAVLYWDGLGGTGLHANEIGPALAEYGLRVVAPDAPGHGRSRALPPDSYRPSRLAGLAAELLSALGIERAAFLGFSWGGRVGCSFAALFPERTASLALVDGGIFLSRAAGDLAACIVEARKERDEDSFPSWDAFFEYERDSLGRWTPAVAEAHRAIMREENGLVVPILEAETLGAIIHGDGLEPVTETYPLIAAAEIPVLLVTAPRPGLDMDSTPVTRFRSALPEARVESIAGGIHDLVSYAPDRVAELVGEFLTADGQPPP
jgi:pimeloyl-ACP methyl ester carboxylesterase